jgi:hypothetical protein
MIYWAPFLHFYQPSFQFHKVLQKICKDCYRPLLEVLLRNPHIKVTVNINGVLTELLHEHGAADILERFKELASRGQLEFVGSAKFHPILPLLPSQEAERQIRLNHEANSHFFGQAYKPRGFFPPEMCYSAGAAKIIKHTGHDWVLLSGVAHPETWPLDFVSHVGKKSPLGFFYRDDIISNKISFKEIDAPGFVRWLMELAKGRKDIYIITAMDAETFGHHIPGWQDSFLLKVCELITALADTHNPSSPASKEAISDYQGLFEGFQDVLPIETTTISGLTERFPARATRGPKPSSWSTSKEDIARKNYYPLWKEPGNRIHELQWEHLNICFRLTNLAEKIKRTTPESENFTGIARALLDKAFTSCQFWWANKSRGLWSPNLIHKGLILQEETMLNAYKAIRFSLASSDIKKEAYYKTMICRKIASNIKDMLVAD